MSPVTPIQSEQESKKKAVNVTGTQAVVLRRMWPMKHPLMQWDSLPPELGLQQNTLSSPKGTEEEGSNRAETLF